MRDEHVWQCASGTWIYAVWFDGRPCIVGSAATYEAAAERARLA